MIATEHYMGQPTPNEGDLFRTLFDSNPLPMWIYDLETLRFLAVNEAAVRRYGYSRPEFLGMSINDLRPPEEVDPGKKPVDGKPVIREWRGWRHRLKSGAVIEVDITTQGLKYEGHRAAFVIVNSLLGQNRSPQTSQESEDRFRLIFEKNNAPMILYEPESGKISDANPSAASFYRYPREKLSSMQIADLVALPGDELLKKLSDSMSGGAGSMIYCDHRLAGGETRSCVMQGTEVTVGEKRLVHLIIGEASAQKHEEVAPTEDTPDINRLMELMPEGYYRRTPEDKFVEANQAFASMLGYTRKELLSPDVSGSIYVDAPVLGSNNEMREYIVVPETYRLRKKDGVEIEVEDHARYVRDDAGKIVYREGFCREITHHPAAQPGTNKYEQFFRESSEIVLFFRKADGKIVEASRASEAVYGYSREELLEKTIYDLRPADSWESLQQRINTADGSGIVFETMHKRKDGSGFPVETRLQRLAVDGEDYFVSISRDLTTRKSAETALKRSEEKYRSIFEKSPLGILHFDDNGIITDCSESLANIMGSSRKSVIGLKLLELPSKELVSAVRSVLEGKLGVYEGEYRSFTSNKTIHVRTTFTAIAPQGVSAAGGIGIFEDITEKDKADDAIRESEMRYRLLYENSPVPYHLLDARWKIVDVNTSWMDLLGYRKGEAVEKDFVEFVAPEHADLLKERLEAFKTAGALGNLEVDVIAKDGRRVTVAVEGKIVRNPDGEIQQAQFMLYDITQRKMAENALRESEQKFKTLAESASTAIFMYQRNKICYVNAACVRVTGYSEEELLKMDFWDVVHPDFRELVKELGMARQRGETVPNHFELRVRTKSGESRWIDFTAATTTYKGDVAVLGTVYDVTERRNAREKLEESEEQHRLLVDKSPDAIMVLTEDSLVYVNPAALKLLGADSTEAIVGNRLLDLVHPDSHQRIAGGLDEMHKSLKPVELESEKFLRGDGSSLDVHVIVAPITYLGKPSVQVVARDMTNRMSVQEQLRLQNVALKTAANAIVVTDKEGVIVWANPAFETLTGYSVSEATGRKVFDITGSGEQDERFYKSLWDTILSGSVWHGEIINRRNSGTLYTEDLTITPVLDDKGAVTHFVWIKQDITMRKSFEDQLLQAKKLEGIGELAGGVAHDYNNILGVILGYGELLKRKLNEHDPARMPVEAILTATRRGADLTKQLLAFAQKGVMSPRVVDVNKSIDTVEGMLQRIIGDSLKLEIVPLKGLWNVRIDPTHLDQMLVNLAANARDAITGDSGTIEIKSSNVVVDESFVRKHVGFTPGEYVMISVSDTGRGMNRNLQERIFEPFFTTKQKGQASGLGLATVYGIVKRNNGAITVRSAPGEGTTFCIYLPRFDKEQTEEVEEMVSPQSLRSSETVLLVEDQADLIELVKENLEEYGYKVMTALDAEEAIVFCEAYPEKIDVLLTDVILPAMNGRELSEKIAALRPGIKTLFMSGYSANALAPEGVLGDGVEFLQKPFTAYELAKKVHKVLYP